MLKTFFEVNRVSYITYINVAQNSFQHLDYNHSLSLGVTIMIAKNAQSVRLVSLVQFLPVIYNMYKTKKGTDQAPNLVNRND